MSFSWSSELFEQRAFWSWSIGHAFILVMQNLTKNECKAVYQSKCSFPNKHRAGITHLPILHSWCRRRDAGRREGGGDGLSCGGDVRKESEQASTSSRLTCNTPRTEFRERSGDDKRGNFEPSEKGRSTLSLAWLSSWFSKSLPGLPSFEVLDILQPLNVQDNFSDRNFRNSLRLFLIRWWELM